MAEDRLQAKVSGFVPGVDMVDGKCDVDTAHYFIQVYADGDVYTVRRTVLSFVDLDRDLSKRFPKLGLMELPVFDIDGSKALRKPRKIDTFLKKSKARSDVLLGVDDLMRLQPNLTQWLASLIAVEPVLACEEVGSFLTDSSPMDINADEKDAEGGKSRSAHEQKIKITIERFGKGRERCLEQVLTESTPVVKQKIQPSQSHTVTMNVEEAGHVLVWCFTTLPGKSSPAKDIAFSLSFNGTVVRPYERYSKAPTELIKGFWQCPTSGVATFQWHNDYSKWNAKYVALKTVVLVQQQFVDAQMRLKKTAEEKQERDERREALTRAMNSTQDNAGSLDLFGDFPDRASISMHGSRPSEESSLESAQRPASIRVEAVSSVSKQGTGDQAALKKEVARLEAALVELTQENATQREQMDTLANAGRGTSGSTVESSLGAELANSERTCVKLGQQLATLTKQHSKEKQEHEELKEKYEELAKKFSERDDAIEKIQTRRAALEAQVSSLKEEKKILKSVAKQYKEAATTSAHELLLIRQHQAVLKEKDTSLNSDSMSQTSLEVFAKTQQSNGNPVPSKKAQKPTAVVATGCGDLSEEEAELRLWSSRVSAFYGVYCPSKAGEGCRETAKKFKGRETDLFSALYHKYTVEETDQTFHTAVPPGWRDVKK